MYRQCIMGNYNMEIEGVSESERSFLEKFKPFVNHQNISEINSIMLAMSDWAKSFAPFTGPMLPAASRRFDVNSLGSIISVAPLAVWVPGATSMIGLTSRCVIANFGLSCFIGSVEAALCCAYLPIGSGIVKFIFCFTAS